MKFKHNLSKRPDNHPVPLSYLYQDNIIKTDLRWSVSHTTYAFLLAQKFGGAIVYTEYGFVLTTNPKPDYKESKELVDNFKKHGLPYRLYFRVKARLTYPKHEKLS